MNFFKFLNFPLKFTEIPVSLCFQLASVTINFTDNHDYQAVLYSMVPILPQTLTMQEAKEPRGVGSHSSSSPVPLCHWALDNVFLKTSLVEPSESTPSARAWHGAEFEARLETLPKRLLD